MGFWAQTLDGAALETYQVVLNPASGPFQRDVLYPCGTGSDYANNRSCTSMYDYTSKLLF